MSETSELLDAVRAVVRETLAERDRQAEEQRLGQEQREAEELASIRRRDLTPLQKSQLIDRLGYAGYMALPYSDDPPRDGLGPLRR